MLPKFAEEAYEAALEYTSEMFEIWLDRHAMAKIDPAVAAKRIYCFFEEGFMANLLKDVEEDDSPSPFDFLFS